MNEAGNHREPAVALTPPAIYAERLIPQPPDQRTYSAEVTSLLSNLPHHRRLRPKQALDYDTLKPIPCQELSRFF